MNASWRVVAMVATAILGAGGTAHALKPAKHRDLAINACVAAHLPTAFCQRIGEAAFNTDAQEWDDLAAHAQREEGQPRCEAADAALARVDGLAREAIERIRGGDDGGGADLLGRALHTIQDECAHHGMTNPEHAHYSLEATCSSADVNPDTQPAAVACAAAQTTAALQVIAAELAVAPAVPVGPLGEVCPTDYTNDSRRTVCDYTVLPGPTQACAFLATHTAWDGVDTRWEATAVGGQLVAALAAGLAGGPAPAPACGAGPIDPIAPPPVVDVAAADVSCFVASVGCLGKVDGEPGAPAAATSSEPGGGGCSTSGGRSWLPLLAVAGVVARRRRRARSPG
jgi:hypothetical protein